MKSVSLKLACMTLGVAIAAISGCASKESHPPLTGVEPQGVPEPDLRSFHSSWSHSTRGGAAVRKPGYQHVLATWDQLDVPVGRLYPAASPAGAGSSAANTADHASGQTDRMSHSAGGTDPSMGSKPPCSADQRVIASAREMTDDYIRVRDKLCSGAERLTFEEWQVLVNGTPKDVPASLQTFPSPTTFPASSRQQ